MASKQFKVSFYYHTDCRTEWIGEASNDLAALAIATVACSDTEDWCDHGRGFKIVIERIFPSFTKEP